MSSDLINIKERYGEKMMHLCRKLFPTILETEGKLFDLLSSHFVYSRNLYDDIVDNSLENMFQNYIYSLMTKDDEELFESSKTPFELLNDVGYDLYECNTEEEIQSYRKYYHAGEELCSFRGGRLDKCYVFFAVKKDADNIKREDFINPMRQDKYGTSVISIQFTKGNVNTLSIKNRYNHEVFNPDATFSNNLENIVPGLTKSFERDYNLNIKQNECGGFEIPGYVLAKDGKYYKYNYEINNIYYCPDNIRIDNFEVIRDYQEKEKYIIADYFIVDLVSKKIYLYDSSIEDSFLLTLSDIKKIEIKRVENNRLLYITFKDGNNSLIEIDKCNRIISYVNNNITSVEDKFLYKNKYLEKIHMPNCLDIGDNFLSSNYALVEIALDKVLKIGSMFLSSNEIMEEFRALNVLKVGDNFLNKNKKLHNLCMPNINVVGSGFLSSNTSLCEVNFPNLVSIGNSFLYYNRTIKSVILPKAVYIGHGFISVNSVINEISFPNLKEVGDSFLWYNQSLTSVDMRCLEKVGGNFIYANKKIHNVNFPKLRFVGISFMPGNNSLEVLELPQLVFADNNFLYNNNSLRHLYAPNLVVVRNDFLRHNSVLNNFDLSSLCEYGRYFLYSNGDIKKRVLKTNN